MNRCSLTCDAVIKLGAQDDTLVYLSLLPRELREEIDRRLQSAAWLFTGKLKRLDLPAEFVCYPFARTVSSEGEPVLVCGATDKYGKKAHRCHILRLNRSSRDTRSIITLRGNLLGVDEGAFAMLSLNIKTRSLANARPCLFLTAGSPTLIVCLVQKQPRVYDIDGREVNGSHTPPPAMALLGPFFFLLLLLSFFFLLLSLLNTRSLGAQ